MNGERRELMSSLSNKRKAQLLFWAFLFVLVFIANLPSKEDKLEPFPAPDPDKGRALGWDFKEGDYRYESEKDREFIPHTRAKAPSTKPYRVRHGLKITSLDDIKNIDDLNDYIDQRSRRKVIYIREEITEDDARDILDYGY